MIIREPNSFEGRPVGLSEFLVSDRASITMTNQSHYAANKFKRRRKCRDLEQEEDKKVSKSEASSDLSPAATRRSHKIVPQIQSGTATSFLFLLFLVLIIPCANLNSSSFVVVVSATSTPQPADALARASSQHLVPSATNSLASQQQLVAANTSSTLTSNTSQANTTSDILLNLVKNNFNKQHQPYASGLTMQPSNNNTRHLPAAFAAHSRPGQKHDHVHYKTTFACDGNRMDLSCQEGKLIHLVRATYGRFSLSICNELNHVNLNVHCAKYTAFLIMQTRCDKLSNCSVDVSTELFGDPCEGTSKYLEVQYYCDDVNNNSQQQQPPAALQPGFSRPANQQQQVATAPGAGSASGNKSPPSSSPANVQLHNQQVGGGSSHQAFDSGRTDEQQQLPSVIEDAPSGVSQQPGTVIQQQQQQHCLAQKSARNTFWNHTLAGQVARQSCPDGSTGKATWRCDPDRLRFVPAWSPDFTRCKSNWLQRLSHQLDQMLEQLASRQLLGPEYMRDQSEQLLKAILSDLVLMAKTKELFSEDLKRIDMMLGRISAHMRSLPTLYARGADANSYSGTQLLPLYEDLFGKSVAIVSSLFDVQQRSAWLEVQPDESRRQLELRFLEHLKETGALLAYVAGPWAPEQLPVRQAHVSAGITVIPGLLPAQQGVTGRLRELMYGGASPQQETNEFNLQRLASAAATSRDRFVSDTSASSSSFDEQANEFRIQLSTLQPLIANGITRFLVLDVKKPDYSLIRQQLETVYGDGGGAALEINNNLASGDQQWSSQVFGVFPIAGESGHVFDGHANNQQEQKLADVLVESPISVDFRVYTSPGQQLTRQCNSLSDNANNLNRCQTLALNATNHVCRCARFGFVSLTSLSSSQVPSTIGQNVNMNPWPQLEGAPGINSLDDHELRTNQQLGLPRGMEGSSSTFIGAQKQPAAGQQSVGFWTTIFIVFGLSLLVVSLAAFVIQTIVRVSSQSRLSKKQQGFLAAGSSILGHNRDLSAGPTTGPLTDHNLMATDPMTASSATSTNHSTSIIGLTQSACHGYKTHQQLYAAHYPTLEPCDVVANKWRSLTNWLRPSRWLAGRAGGKSVEHLGAIQHRVIGSTLSGAGGAGSIGGYKSQFQNGYTTSLHHHHHQSASAVGNASSQLPLAAPSSSTSSYVSSSAYYEEIGPGNLTKVNPSQLASARATHTIVEPFKQPGSTADQQQLLNDANHNQHLQQLHRGGQHVQATGGWTTMGPYSMDNNQQQLNNGGYGRPIHAPAPVMANTAKQVSHLHNDLSQLQQNPSQSSAHSSGGSSQLSTSTNLTGVNGGSQTPRHYLFASPSAVNAYKSSMNQMTLHQHQQPPTSTAHQQQQYFNQRQEQQQQQRFMPSC